MINVSPTQINKYRTCKRIVGFEYCDGFKSAQDQARSSGQRLHEELAAYLKGGPFPGPVGRQGLQWLPAPAGLLIEHEIMIPISEDITIKGAADCVCPPEFNGGQALVIDHKSTTDLRWAQTPESLADDPQALIYGLWAMRHYNCDSVCCRWVYYAASKHENDALRKPKGSKPVEIIMRLDDPDLMPRFEQLIHDVISIALIRHNKTSGMRLEPSPWSCGKYNGCDHLARCEAVLGDPSNRLAAYMSRGEK